MGFHGIEHGIMRYMIYDDIWVNYNDLTTTSLEIMVSIGHDPQNGLNSG